MNCTKLDLKENEVDNLKIVPLIFSTSIENDHTLIRGKHLKISLFELEHQLKDYKFKPNRNNLEDLINSIQNNEFWKNLNLQHEVPEPTDRMLKFNI